MKRFGQWKPGRIALYGFETVVIFAVVTLGVSGLQVWFNMPSRITLFVLLIAAILPLVVHRIWPEPEYPKSAVTYHIHKSPSRRAAMTNRGMADVLLCTVTSFVYTAGQFDHTFTVKVALRPVRPVDEASGESREFVATGLSARDFAFVAELCRKTAPDNPALTLEVDSVLDPNNEVIGIGNQVMGKMFLKKPLA